MLLNPIPVSDPAPAPGLPQMENFHLLEDSTSPDWIVWKIMPSIKKMVCQNKLTPLPTVTVPCALALDLEAVGAHQTLDSPN